MPASNGEPVGCVLINDTPARPRACEVVYIGTRPRFRRRGFARAMLRHAMADAARLGKLEMFLAVDGSNTPARRLYQSEGFVEFDRRNVHICPARAASDSPCEKGS